MAVPLRQEYRDRVLWHLTGTGSGTSLGDRTRIEEAMNAIPSTLARCGVFEALDLCDIAYTEFRKGFSGMVALRADTYAGDVSRTVARSERGSNARRELEETYRSAVETLAHHLQLPLVRGVWERGGGEWV